MTRERGGKKKTKLECPTYREGAVLEKEYVQTNGKMTFIRLITTTFVCPEAPCMIPVSPVTP